MFGSIKQAGREGLIYTVTYGLQGAIAFLLVPLYTRALSQSDFGKLGLLLPLGVVAGTLVSMGLNTAIFRSYFDYEEAQARRLVVNTTLILLVLASLAVVLAGVPLIPPLSQALFSEVESAGLIWLVIVKGIATSFGGVPLAVYRARGQAMRFAVLTLITALMKVAAILYLVLVARWGLMGVIGGDALTAAIAAAITLWTIRKDIALEFSKPEARKLLRFGLPLVPADLASMVFTRVDLFFLNHFTDLRTVGQYNAAALLMQAMQTLIRGPFALAWTPIVLSVHKKEYANSFYAHVTVYVMMISGFMALLISVFSAEIMRIVAGPGFETAAQALPLLCAAQVAYIVQICFNTGITLERKTQYVLFIRILVAATAVAANFLLIPVWGMMGAAVSNLVSALVFAGATHVIANRLYPIAQDWPRIAKSTLLFGLTFMLATALNAVLLDLHLIVRTALVFIATLILSLPLVWYSLEAREKIIAKRELAALAARTGIHKQTGAEPIEPKS